MFSRDHLDTLVVRLRSSVIRTGLRRINASYSRISFQDVAQRLALDSSESAELACANAIRDDGVIEATINHETGHLLSSEVLDITRPSSRSRPSTFSSPSPSTTTGGL